MKVRYLINKNMFSRGTIVAFLVILTVAGFASVKFVKSNMSNIKTIKIGIVKGIDHPAVDATAEAAASKLEKDLPNARILYESAQGDANLAKQIIQKFIQQRASAIITVGTTVTQVAMNTTKNIPIVFASVTDPVGSGIVRNLESPAGNVTGVSNLSPEVTEQQMVFFKELLPDMKTIAVIYNPGESNSSFLVSKIKNQAEKMNIKIKEGVAQNTNEAVFVTRTLIKDVDAVLVDNDNTALAAIGGIIQIASEANKPVLCSDIDTINLGVLASVGPDQRELGEQAAEMVLKVLGGKKVSEIPVEYPNEINYIVNGETAEKLSVKIPTDDKIEIAQ